MKKFLKINLTGFRTFSFKGYQIVEVNVQVSTTIFSTFDMYVYESCIQCAFI